MDLPDTEIIGLLDPDATQFGIDPSTAPFGTRDFHVADGSAWPPLKAHSQYWTPNSTSLQNMAHIVDGQYGQVLLASGQSVAPDPDTAGSDMPGTPYP